MPLTFPQRAAHRTAAALLALTTALALPGCARYYYGAPAHGVASIDLIAANYLGVDSLLNRLPQQAQKISVTALVPADPHATPSWLGRLLSEQIAGRLVQRGHMVSGPRLGGEGAAQTSVSADWAPLPGLPAISPQSGVQAVVGGSYTVSQRTLYVSLRWVRALDNSVLAASDYAIAIDDDVRSLLTAP